MNPPTPPNPRTPRNCPTAHGSPAGAPRRTSSLDSTTLARLVTSALERTAFVMAEPCEAAAPAMNDSCIATRIGFSGAAVGECRLQASEGFVRELTAGFLSVEPDEVDVAVQGQDAMNELSNIVAGLVIRELGNATNRIFLGLPTVAQSHPSADDSPIVSCTLDSMGERLSVTVVMQQAIARAA